MKVLAYGKTLAPNSLAGFLKRLGTETLPLRAHQPVRTSIGPFRGRAAILRTRSTRESGPLPQPLGPATLQA